jgi:hypothetical protein
VDPSGNAAEKIGYVYVVRGVDPRTGQPVTYTGSTIQELKSRFKGHKWLDLIKADTTTIEVQEVKAEPNVAGSGRGTQRSAKMEAVRALEEPTRQQVAREQGKPLNRVRAATEQNAEAWKKTHGVEGGRTFTHKKVGGGASAVTVAESASATSEGAASAASGKKPPGGTSMKGTAGVFIGLALIDGYRVARQEVESEYVVAPYLLEDEGGVFTIESDRNLFDSVYQKRYVSGDREGEVAAVEKEEFHDLQEEAQALWGYVDWKGEWVPGKLRTELPEVDQDVY